MARLDHDYDPCPEGAEGVVDFGHGVRGRFFNCSGDFDGTDAAGLIESHPTADGGRCSGGIQWRTCGPSDKQALWTLHSLSPLHVEPSILCRTCGHHGFIRDGAWVPA